MKATGVLRRIDDLGRIVIPKEIRKNLKIREGESLEIYVEDDKIVLTKYSEISGINTIAGLCADAANELTNTNIIITDNDKVIAAAGSLKRKYLDQPISENIANIISKRETYINSNGTTIKISPNSEEITYFVGSPVIANSDAIGLVAAISADKALTEVEEKAVQLTAKLLGKQIEG